jgi:hypothetical protein
MMFLHGLFMVRLVAVGRFWCITHMHWTVQNLKDGEKKQ